VIPRPLLNFHLLHTAETNMMSIFPTFISKYPNHNISSILLYMQAALNGKLIVIYWLLSKSKSIGAYH